MMMKTISGKILVITDQ